MGASDYMVGNAPAGASYQMGNMAQQLYQMIGGLPQDYFQGTQNARTLQQQNLFKGGLPQDAQGQPDISAIAQKISQTGGAESAQALLPFLLKQQLLQQESGGQPQQPQPSVNQNTSPTGQTPAMLQRPSGGSAGSGDNGRNTITSMVTQNADDPDAAGATIAKVAQYTGLDPNAPITNPRDVTRVQNAMKAAGLRVQTASGAPAGAGSRVPTATTPEEPNDTTPVGTGGPAQAAPSQAAPGGGGQVSPSPQGDSFVDRFGAAGGATNMVPRGYDPRAYAEALKKRAEALRVQGDRRGIVGIPSKAKEDQASALDKQADAILEQLGKAGELTGEEKNARNPAVEAFKRREETVKADIEQSKKKYDGLQNLGQVGQIGNQKLDRIRAIMSDPNFMSGAGHSIAQAWNQWNVTLGGNPSKAQPMEEFNKTAQQLLTDDIKAMGQSGAGPVRVAEVQIMQKATANLGISPATNRYLVEEAYRVHNDNIAVARMAQQYKEQHGYLDAGWDKIRDKYYSDHPLFTKEELADPRLVAPPYMPKEIAADPARRVVWLKQQGLKSGDPFRTDNPDNPIHYLK
jgi:hypothetical protein